jgi:hypothetical protein
VLAVELRSLAVRVHECDETTCARRDDMAKGGNKRRGRRKKKANHGKRPNA